MLNSNEEVIDMQLTLDLRHGIILVLGVLGLIKALLGLIRPFMFKDMAKWWVRVMTRHVNTLIGCVLILMAGGMWTVVLLNAELVDWFLVGFGALAGWLGFVYFKRESIERLIDVVIINRRKVGLQIMFAITGIISILFIWVALTGANTAP